MLEAQEPVPSDPSPLGEPPAAPPPDGGGGIPDGPVDEPPKPSPPSPIDEPPGTGGAPAKEPPAGPDDVEPPISDPRLPGQPSRKEAN